MYLGSFVLLLCTYWVLCVPFFLYKVCFLPIKKKEITQNAELSGSSNQIILSVNFFGKKLYRSPTTMIISVD